MGQTPSKFFPMPTPYGQSPDMGVLQQAKAAPPAPLNNFLPLNAPDPSQQQPTRPAVSGFQGQLGGNARALLGGNLYGIGAQRARNIYD